MSLHTGACPAHGSNRSPSAAAPQQQDAFGVNQTATASPIYRKGDRKRMQRIRYTRAHTALLNFSSSLLSSASTLRSLSSLPADAKRLRQRSMLKDHRHDNSHALDTIRGELARGLPDVSASCTGGLALGGESGSRCAPSESLLESGVADVRTTAIGGNDTGGGGGGGGGLGGRGGGAFRQSGPRHPSVHSQCPLVQLPSRANNQASADEVRDKNHL